MQWSASHGEAGSLLAPDTMVRHRQTVRAASAVTARHRRPFSAHDRAANPGKAPVDMLGASTRGGACGKSTGSGVYENNSAGKSSGVRWTDRNVDENVAGGTGQRAVKPGGALSGVEFPKRPGGHSLRGQHGATREQRAQAKAQRAAVPSSQARAARRGISMDMAASQEANDAAYSTMMASLRGLMEL